MSGIYIPGMEMPRKTGIVSVVLSGDGSALLCEDGAYSDITVIPVPDHGRLIDADVKEKDGWYLERHVRKADGYWIEIMPLKDAHTIIPADPAKEGEE